MLFLTIGELIGARLANASAKEKNEKAQEINKEAQQLYDSAKSSLESAKSIAEGQIKVLGKSKVAVLQTSVAQFLKYWEKIKDIQLKESAGIDEIRNFQFTQSDILQLQKISQESFNNTYEMANKLAVSGTTFAVGGAAMEAGILGATGTALGAVISSLASIAAPVVVFTAFSASMKADENLQKAQENYSKASLAAEKMKTEQVKCEAIYERTKIFDDLLIQLNDRFSDCVGLMTAVVKKKTRFRRKVTQDIFTDEEQALFAVTRALAGAVKAIIDMPILSSNGELTTKSEEKAAELKESLPKHKSATEKIKKYDFKVKPKKSLIAINYETGELEKSEFAVMRHDAIGIIIGLSVSLILPFDFWIKVCIFSVISMFWMYEVPKKEETTVFSLCIKKQPNRSTIEEIFYSIIYWIKSSVVGLMLLSTFGIFINTVFNIISIKIILFILH